MRQPLLLGMVTVMAVSAMGCAPSDDAPGPPPPYDSGLDGQTVVIPGGPRDLGHTSADGSTADMGGCLAEPLDARVLVVIDRSDTMAEFALGGDGVALNVLASTAAADLVADLPSSSSAGLLLFPGQTLDEPDCPSVPALAQQYPLRDPTSMEGTLRALWGMEGVILGKPRARAMQRAAEGLPETDLADTLVVLFTDGAAGCLAGDETDGQMSLEARGARVVTITLATNSAPAVGSTPARYSRVSEVLAVLRPELDAVRRRCEAP